MPLTRSLLYRICPRGGALATMSTTARIPAVVGGAEAGRGVRAARRARGALRTSTPSTGGARRMPCGGAERGAAHCASTVSPRSPRPAPHGGTSWTPSVQLRYRPGGPANFQRSGAVGACRAHNPEAVGSKPTFATGWMGLVVDSVTFCLPRLVRTRPARLSRGRVDFTSCGRAQAARFSFFALSVIRKLTFPPFPRKEWRISSLI